MTKILQTYFKNLKEFQIHIDTIIILGWWRISFRDKSWLIIRQTLHKHQLQKPNNFIVSVRSQDINRGNPKLLTLKIPTTNTQVR